MIFKFLFNYPTQRIPIDEVCKEFRTLNSFFDAPVQVMSTEEIKSTLDEVLKSTETLKDDTPLSAKKVGLLHDIPLSSVKVNVKTQKVTKRSRCPNGTRRNKKTGDCERIKLQIRSVYDNDRTVTEKRPSPIDVRVDMETERRPSPIDVRTVTEIKPMPMAMPMAIIPNPNPTPKPVKVKRPRCPNRTRRNKKTGNCESIFQMMRSNKTRKFGYAL
jgi:hypothetical protein